MKEYEALESLYRIAFENKKMPAETSAHIDECYHTLLCALEGDKR